MRRAYFWITGIVLAITLLMSMFGGLIFLVVLIFPPIAGMLLGVVQAMPAAALVLLCGLPAVVVWPRRIVSAVFGIGGMVVVWNVFIETPAQSDLRADSFIAETKRDISGWAKPDQLIEYVKEQGSGYGCDQVCQALLFDGGAAAVRNKPGRDTIGVTFRLGRGSDCALIEFAPEKCILLTRTTPQAADLILSHVAGRLQLPSQEASQLGVKDTLLWSLTKPDGDIAFARHGTLQPIDGGPRFAFLSGGLDRLDDRGFIRKRSLKSMGGETPKEFLRRAGVGTGRTPFTEQGWFSNTLTPASRDDALAGDLEPEIRRKLKRFKQRALIPKEVLKGSLDEQLALMAEIWEGNALIGKDTSKVRKFGYVHILKAFPDQRGRVLKPYVDRLRQSGDGLSDPLRHLIDRYRERPDIYKTSDLLSARDEYAAYLEDLGANPRIKAKWLAEHFRVWGMLFGLPPEDVSALNDRTAVGEAMETRCLIATPGDLGAQAYAIAGLARLAEFPEKERNDMFHKRYAFNAMRLAAYAGNLDEAEAYLLNNPVLPAHRMIDLERVSPCGKD